VKRKLNISNADKTFVHYQGNVKVEDRKILAEKEER